MTQRFSEKKKKKKNIEEKSDIRCGAVNRCDSLGDGVHLEKLLQLCFTESGLVAV